VSSRSRRIAAIYILRRMLNESARCRRQGRVFLREDEKLAVIAALRALERKAP
jgi:hypothetical protein